jgi:S1-C subfamily serine protease
MATESFSLSAFSTELADLIERAGSFVVSLDSRPRRPASGIVCGKDLVVTADHVLHREEEITVQAGGRSYPATVAGRDPASDIAVLRVPGLAIAEPQRSDSFRVGMLVVSISRTAAGGLSAGAGVIAAIGGPLRTGQGIVFPQVIRTDAASRPGTSGGAIVDASGRVIGMTTTALLRGLPVAIPAAQVWQIASALASNRTVRRGYLGVSVQPVRLPERQGDRGLLVFGVARDGAADRAGLLVGDVIVGFDDRKLGDADGLQDAIAGVEPGRAVSVGILRGGVPQQVRVTIGERPSD